MLLPVALPAQQAADDAEAQLREPGYAGISIRLIGKPAMLEPMRTITADDLDRDGLVVEQDDRLADAASILVGPHLGKVVFGRGLDLPGSLAICEGSACEVLSDVSLGQYLISLSPLYVLGNLSSAGEIDIAGGLSVTGDISTPVSLGTDSDLAAGGNVSCYALGSDDTRIEQDLTVDGGVFCMGNLWVGGGISCGELALQVYGHLSCDGDIASQGFIYAAWGGITAGGDILCRTDCLAGCGIEAGGTIDAGGLILAALNPGFSKSGGAIRSGGKINGQIAPWPPAIIRPRPVTQIKAETRSETTTSAYDEVPLGHWSYRALDYLCRSGVLEGYPEGFFRDPSQTEEGELDFLNDQRYAAAERGDSSRWQRILTRYEFAQAIARLQDTVLPGDKSYPEVVHILEAALVDEYYDQLQEICRFPAATQPDA
jgi:hypothetical protein